MFKPSEDSYECSVDGLWVSNQGGLECEPISCGSMTPPQNSTIACQGNNLYTDGNCLATCNIQNFKRMFLEISSKSLQIKFSPRFTLVKETFNKTILVATDLFYHFEVTQDLMEETKGIIVLQMGSGCQIRMP